MKGLLVLDLAPEDDEPFTPGPTEVGSGESRTSRTAPAEARAVCEAGGRKAMVVDRGRAPVHDHGGQSGAGIVKSLFLCRQRGSEINP
jgi:hypothetical protein